MIKCKNDKGRKERATQIIILKRLKKDVVVVSVSSQADSHMTADTKSH